MEKGGDVKKVFERLAKGIQAVEESVKKESGHAFMKDEKYGYIHSCPTNLGTGMFGLSKTAGIARIYCWIWSTRPQVSGNGQISPIASCLLNTRL